MTRLIPPVQAGLWLLGQQAVAAVVGRRRPHRGAAVAGAALVGAGAALGAAALATFVARDTTWHPQHPEKATHIVTEGPNRWTRNPMYVAMAAGLVGTGLLSGRSWTATAALGLVATLTPQVRREEVALESLFGRDWAEYAARVPRWVGWPRG